MTNEEAIAIIRKEYLCVDRDCDIERSCGKCDLMIPSKEPILEAYNMAIKALETIPKYKDTYYKGWCDGAYAVYEHLKMCEEEQDNANQHNSNALEGDAISRQAVLDLISNFIMEIPTEGGRDLNAPTNDVLRQILRNVGSDRVLPPVNPQPCEDAISRQKVLDVINLNWDYRRNCIRAIEQLPSVNSQEPKWIPVGERLPEIDEPVLIFQRYYSGANITIGRYHSDEKQGGYRYWQWIKYDNHFSYGIDHFGIICPDSYYVDAWMPLPKPYEPQERSE